MKWIEEEIDLPKFDITTFYNSVWDFFAQGGEAVVPLAESMEVMRIIDLCRQIPIEDLNERAK